MFAAKKSRNQTMIAIVMICTCSGERIKDSLTSVLRDTRLVLQFQLR
jgi:hypothetical protein